MQSWIALLRSLTARGLAAICATLLLTAPALSQEPATQGRRIAMLPVVCFKDKKNSTNKEVIAHVNKSFNYAWSKMEVSPVEDRAVRDAWKELHGEAYDETKWLTTPSVDDLANLGTKLGVDLVAFARCRWHVRSIWVFLGPETRASAALDLLIVDVAKREVALRVDELKAKDTDDESVEDAEFCTSYLAPLLVFSGGPETPHMKVAGAVAVIKALEPWLKKITNRTMAPRSG